MKQHKWAKEIKAWADGAEIEYRKVGEDKWASVGLFPGWSYEQFEYRIKPEPQYLYVYSDGHATLTSLEKAVHHSGLPLKGKIKLEDEDDEKF